MNSIEAELNAAHGGNWDAYRQAGLWVVSVTGPNGHRKVFESSMLTCAMEMAIEAKFLPVVPRPPEPLRWIVKRSDHKRRMWYIEDLATGCRTNGYKTKKEAQQRADKEMERSMDALAGWNAKWRMVMLSGTEGVDWEFEA